MSEHTDKAKILITVEGAKTSVEIEGCAGGMVKAFTGLLIALQKDESLRALFNHAIDEADQHYDGKGDEPNFNVVAISGEDLLKGLGAIVDVLQTAKAEAEKKAQEQTAKQPEATKPAKAKKAKKEVAKNEKNSASKGKKSKKGGSQK